MNLLGIDYGERFLGLAYSEGKQTQNLTTINIKEEDRLQKICRDLNIAKVIVGLPDGRLKTKVIAFVEKLKTLLNIEIVLWDETLTSQDAQNMLFSTNKSRKKRHEKEHSVAAALILQSYLDNL